jgi:hypothetical protein
LKPMTIELGADAVTTPAFMLDYMIAPFQVSVALVSLVGAVDVSLQVAYDDPAPFAPGESQVPVFNWFPVADFLNETAAAAAVLTAPVTVFRIVKTGTGTAVVRVIQAGK